MEENNNILLSTAYFGPIQYFSKLLIHNNVYIEQYEHFIKQTYRNRCNILGANGVIPLIVPVVKGRGKKIMINELKISYDTDWQRNHWRTIFSAYNSSPYFEYYADELRPFFEKPYKYLFDYNNEILQTILNLLDISATLKLTTNFEEVPEHTLNYRESISPKKRKNVNDPYFNPYAYTQVFSDRHNFSPNLSILDLLFNEGPNSYNILNLSCSKAGTN